MKTRQWTKTNQKGKGSSPIVVKKHAKVTLAAPTASLAVILAGM